MQQFAAAVVPAFLVLSSSTPKNGASQRNVELHQKKE